MTVKMSTPTLSQVLHGNPKHKTTGELLQDLYETNTKFTKAQTHLSCITAENMRIKFKLNNIRRHYDQLLATVKAINPTKAAPYLKYAYDPRMF